MEGYCKFTARDQPSSEEEKDYHYLYMYNSNIIR